MKRGAIRYIERTRAYYAAQGYERAYRWARFDEVPFTRLAKPLSACRATLITTAALPQSERAQSGALRGERAVWSGKTAVQSERLATDHLAWDKENTHTDDVESFLPIRWLQRCVDAGRLGSLAPRFHGVPTDFSQRRTLEHDAPEILNRCLEDEVDIALLVPLWPVCHQTVSLVARHLESQGMVTAVIGSARDQPKKRSAKALNVESSGLSR